MDEYFMGIAFAVRERANCRGNRVGAVIVRGNRVIATGYNGVPEGMPNCLDGGCLRCSNPGGIFPSGHGYDICICVHAEQNAVLSAARFGTPTEGATIYTTTRPCFGCTKELLQAKVISVNFIHDWTHPDDEFMRQYRLIQARFTGGIRQVAIDDPRANWAESRVRPATDSLIAAYPRSGSGSVPRGTLPRSRISPVSFTSCSRRPRGSATIATRALCVRAGRSGTTSPPARLRNSSGPRKRVASYSRAFTSTPT
jgi:dCMP deaminase